MDSGPTLEGSGVEPLGAGISSVAEETGLGPSGVPEVPVIGVSVILGTTVLPPATEVRVAEHWVQIVETEVKVTVETVCEVVTKVEESEVTVLVTGQVVTVS